MDEEDVALFARLGLGLEAKDAAKVARMLAQGCSIGVIVGSVLLAGQAFKDMGRVGHKVPKSLALVMIAAGLGLALAEKASICAQIRSHILEYLQRFPTSEAAAGALTPAERADLRAEAQKYLALSPMVDELFKGQPAKGA